MQRQEDEENSEFEKVRMMKIDFAALRALVASGVTAAALVDYLEQKHQEAAPKRQKRAADRKRQRATSGDNRRQSATLSDKARQEATIDDSPRARMFRECVPALIALNITEGRARALLGTWLKETHDDEQLVTAAVLRAKEMNAADVPGYVLGIIQSKRNGKRPHNARRRSDSADFFAGLAAVAADIDGNGDLAGPADQDIPAGRVNIDAEPAGRG